MSDRKEFISLKKKLNNMLKKIWHDPVLSKVIAASLIAFVGGIYSYHEEINIKYFAGFIVVIVAIAAFVYQSSKPISWNFEGFLGMTCSSEKIEIFTFQAHGKNRKSFAIESISGFIKSNITNEVVPLYINLQGNLIESTKLQSIVSGADFFIIAPFGPVIHGYVSKGISPELFLSTFSDFTFHVVVDGKEFRKRIRTKKSERIITEFRKQISPNKTTIFIKKD